MDTETRNLIETYVQARLTAALDQARAFDAHRAVGRNLLDAAETAIAGTDRQVQSATDAYIALSDRIEALSC